MKQGVAVGLRSSDCGEQKKLLDGTIEAVSSGPDQRCHEECTQVRIRFTHYVLCVSLSTSLTGRPIANYFVTPQQECN